MIPGRTTRTLPLLLLAGCCSRDIYSFTLQTNSKRTASVAPSSRFGNNSESETGSRRASYGPRGFVPFIVDGLRCQQQNLQRRSGRYGFPLSMASSPTGVSAKPSDVQYPSALDGEALQSLFAKHCDGDGLMTEERLRSVPAIKEMLEQGDLFSTELAEIWKAAPKFPNVDEDETPVDKIDVDSFTQVFRDIDDLFEDDYDDQGREAINVEQVTNYDEDEQGEDADLKRTFATLANDGKLTSFSQLRQWKEVVSMIDEEGILGEHELVSLWENALGVKGTDGSMDLEGFVDFNRALDDLFYFEDKEEVSDDAGCGDGEQADLEKAPAAVEAPLPFVTEEDLPPGVLFSQLTNENYLVGKAELQRWGELNDMLNEGDLTIDELNSLFANATKAPGTKDMLDEDGFCALVDAIDNLFEDDDGDEEEESKGQPTVKELKEELLNYVEDTAKLAEEEGLQKCCLDSSDLQQEIVLQVVSEMEREPYNEVNALRASGGGAVRKEVLVGSWDLIYSSSSTMKYNEGLSGLAGGLTRFGGLQQKLSATKYLSDVEYTEKVIGKLGGQSFEVKITGDWDLRTELSLFTGRPSDVLSVMPDKVSYGPRSDKADHWKSLGPMNLLVLSYLDEDLRIMRGNTSTDTLFIWRRNK